MCSKAAQSFHEEGLPRAVSEASQAALSFLSSGTGCLESSPRPALEFAEKGPAKARGVMMVADVAARTVVAPAELPVGILTALLGCPFFLFLLKSRKEVQDGAA